MSIHSIEPSHIVGSVNDAANELYDELLTTGSSLLLTDVIKVFVNAVKEYVGWSGRLLTEPPAGVDPAQPTRLVIDENTVLSVADWLIIKPLVMAHCELVQAKRMEGAQGLGVNPTGMGTSEARSLYNEALRQMQKEAFQCEPFTVDTPQDNKGISLLFQTNEGGK